VRDDEEQFERACDLIRARLGRKLVCVSLLVLLETEWVLRSDTNSAGRDPGTFSELLSAGDVRFEDEPAMRSSVYVEGLVSAVRGLSDRCARLGIGCRATALLTKDFEVTGLRCA